MFNFAFLLSHIQVLNGLQQFNETFAHEFFIVRSAELVGVSGREHVDRIARLKWNGNRVETLERRMTLAADAVLISLHNIQLVPAEMIQRTVSSRKCKCFRFVIDRAHGNVHSVIYAMSFTPLFEKLANRFVKTRKYLGRIRESVTFDD